MDRTAFVVTSIYDIRDFLASYHANLEFFHHLDDVRIYVLSDKKAANDGTEDVNGITCQEYRDKGLDVSLFRYKPLLAHVKNTPYLETLLNTAVRFGCSAIRNFGFLIAANDGYKRIVSLDDDNLAPIGDDFYHGHSLVGKNQKMKTVDQVNGDFINTCDFLKFDHLHKVFARGFPLTRRAYQLKYSFKRASGTVALNLGLWTGTPDIHAIDTLLQPIVRSEGWDYDQSQWLAVDNFSYLPLNTQNACIDAKWLPSYYFWDQDLSLGGFKLGRFDDIWQGYVTKFIIDNMQGNNLVTFGNPLTRHHRNAHDPITDLKQEYIGHMLNTTIVDWITSISIYETKDLHQAVREFSGSLHSLATKATYLHPLVQQYLQRIASNYVKWVDACAAVGL